MSRLIKTISFKDGKDGKENFVPQYEYLDKQDNASIYVCRLIKADMNKENLDVKVEQIVNRLLSEKHLQTPDDDKEIISGLTGLFD